LRGERAITRRAAPAHQRVTRMTRAHSPRSERKARRCLREGAATTSE
jgi:hypothetical protein